MNGKAAIYVQPAMSACEMTNAGISCMSSGKHGRANAYFQSAVMKLQELVTEESSQYISHGRRTVRLQRVPITILADEKEALSPDGSFEIFATAFNISFRESDNFDHGIAVGVVLYNLALNEHLAAIRRGKMARLLQAKRLYALSKQMLSTAQLDPACSDEVLLLLARLNNEGHCHSMVFDSTQVRCCQDQLLLIYGDSVSLLSDQDSAFFHVACLMVSSFQAGCMPPAA